MIVKSPYFPENRIKPERESFGSPFCNLRYLFEYIPFVKYAARFFSSKKITPYPHPQGVRLRSNGFSHGLKKCSPDTSLHQSADWCRPFESRYEEKSGDHVCGHRIFGRSIGIRTRGLLDPNQARYQTSPYPDSDKHYSEFLECCQVLCEFLVVENVYIT